MPTNSPLHRNAAIQMAANLDSLDRADEAQKHLEALIKQNPGRSRNNHGVGQRAAGAQKVCGMRKCIFERRVCDPKARKIELGGLLLPRYLLRALEAMGEGRSGPHEGARAVPDQPHVLNYLGYSWIDQGIKLDEGMEMIKKAVQQRPDDGYIVDSLGWAYYRVGNYEEATKQLERAIELKPEDPTINDHLGDAYWRVGRVLEARFQWAHARDLKPDAEDLPKIEEKLKEGLPDETSSQAKAGKKSGDGG